MCEQCLRIYPRTKTWNKLVVCRICNLKRMPFILAIEKMKVWNKKGYENKDHSQFKTPHHGICPNL